MVSWPVAAPVTVGSNTTLSVAVCPEFRVNGKLDPDRVKPVPVTAAPLTVTAPVPVDDKIIDCVVAIFKSTLPKLTLVTLMLSVGTVAPSCRAKVFATLPALAVSVAVCAEPTVATVAV